MLRGITVTLYEQTPGDPDPFGIPTYTETPTTVDNVLIGEPTTEDIQTSTQLYGKVIRYMLGIPKGDSHDWMDKKVSWTDAHGFTHVVKTFGYPITGITENIPGPWDMNVRCEEYGG